MFVCYSDGLGDCLWLLVGCYLLVYCVAVLACFFVGWALVLVVQLLVGYVGFCCGLIRLFAQVLPFGFVAGR